MTDLIPPRRGEVLSNKGVGTTRLMEYLERLTRTVNEQTDTDDTENAIGASPASFAALTKKINDLELIVESACATNAQTAALRKSTFDRRYALLVC